MNNICMDMPLKLKIFTRCWWVGIDGCSWRWWGCCTVIQLALESCRFTTRHPLSNLGRLPTLYVKSFQKVPLYTVCELLTRKIYGEPRIEIMQTRQACHTVSKQYHRRISRQKKAKSTLFHRQVYSVRRTRGPFFLEARLRLRPLSKATALLWSRPKLSKSLTL